MANVKNFSQLQQVMERRREEAERAFRRGTQRATDILYKRSRDLLTSGVYDKPVPKVKRTRGKDKGKTVAKWRRTGNLRRAERRRIANPFEGHIYNDADYALPRHNLGLEPSDSRVIPPPPAKKRKTTRIAPWRKQAIVDTDKQRLAAYRGELFDALDR